MTKLNINLAKSRYMATSRGLLMVYVKLENITKSFGDVIAVDHANLNTKDGEFFTLLGPSGCGKTTALRIIAGFTKPDEGDVYFNDQRITDLPPHKRSTGMVFQTYALWPHMNVYENVAYGLKLRKLPKSEIDRRVEDSLRLVGLAGLEKRTPAELSGGQQQRVALARALVIEPQVLLLDEPLSNLDAKLRVQTRTEIRKLQKKLGITTIYVTHDQEEALAISDRIAVMNLGRIQQIGGPREIYEHPQNAFVADFIGVANFIHGRLDFIDEKQQIASIIARDGTPLMAWYDGEAKVGSEVLATVRPEAIEVQFTRKAIAGSNVISGKVRVSSYLGDRARYEIETTIVNGNILRVDTHNPAGKPIHKEGEGVFLIFSAEDLRIVRES